MTRQRGRPAQGAGLSRDDILTAALALLDENGGQGLSMRALAARLSVTPMSLYHHVQDRAGLLRALSDRVYGGVLEGVDKQADQRAEIQAILIRYHNAVGCHPHLTLAIFATPEAFAGVTRQITDRLTGLLANLTNEPHLWRDILIDHAHGSGLPLVAAKAQSMQEHYRLALNRLLDHLEA
ncbi:TetR/AcrR family transcriptional regulator [Massilia sp. erpn]|uniref:TetR/AcrR family transcriptional regulator n=1 Tax=Massilia sp. erpn TaxID=2738142 RepID=UPI0021059BD6|nr:helix-turn-helix domain-containing protein [Massilia sp. erpn]UTY59717.1 TetR/AcrR family transcriptional regulator [Massilia sp. erpn]